MGRLDGCAAVGPLSLSKLVVRLDVMDVQVLRELADDVLEVLMWCSSGRCMWCSRYEQGRSCAGRSQRTCGATRRDRCARLPSMVVVVLEHGLRGVVGHKWRCSEQDVCGPLRSKKLTVAELEALAL
eukprot:2020873-Amphidinium_carterae.1